jgi:hypothetical protein
MTENDSLIILHGPEDDPPDPILSSQIWTQRHLVTLGRIVEVSAANENILRILLGRALQIDRGSAHETAAQVDALFLGLRLPELHRRLCALAALEGMPDWLPSAVAWSKAAVAAAEQRDGLLHRPPALLLTQDGFRVGMSPARRTQEFELLDEQEASREVFAASGGE